MTDTALTDRDKDKFLQALTTGLSVTSAAAKAGRHRNSFYKLAKRDPEFARAREDAINAGTEALEDEALRRARDGTEKPVYQGGKQVGTVREYSDTLIIFLLKARDPHRYRDNMQATLAGAVTVELVNFTGEPMGKHGSDVAPASSADKPDDTSAG